MSATTIASYGSHGQKDVCFGRMLKKSASVQKVKAEVKAEKK
jgi:hypothetical protein